MRALALVALLAVPSLAAGPVTVAQDQYAAARASEASAVRTYGFSTCVAVFLYDGQKKIGGVAHVSAAADAPAMVRLLVAEMERLGASQGSMTAQLFGGWDTSDPEVQARLMMRSTSPIFLGQIKAELARRLIVVTREETLTVPFRDSRPAIRNVSLDLATGVASDYQP